MPSFTINGNKKAITIQQDSSYTADYGEFNQSEFNEAEFNVYQTKRHTLNGNKKSYTVIFD